MPSYIIYILYTAAIAVIVLAMVPKNEIRRLAFYGVGFGALVDVLFVITLTHGFKAAGYFNFGPLAAFGIPFFPPIAWSFFFVAFLYFLPKQRPWNYAFSLLAAAFSTLFSNVLANLGIFGWWKVGGLVIPYILYATWFTTVTYIYQNVLAKRELY